MKTSIIDSSLCNTEFSRETTAELLKEYAVSLFMCGVDYIEIDSCCLPYFADMKASQHFILRIDSPDDLINLENQRFAYVVLPAELIFLAPRIDARIILELNADGFNLSRLLQKLDGNAFAKYISMLRLCGGFSGDENELASFIAWYRRRFILPLDICPSDAEMCGLQNAFAAYKSKADALTFSFGESANYVSLEKFLVYSYTFYGILICPTYIEGICAAALQLSYISGSTEHGMKNLSEILNQQTSSITNIDTAQVTRRRTQTKRKTDAADYLQKIDKELEKALHEMLDTNNLKIAQVGNTKPKSKYLH